MHRVNKSKTKVPSTIHTRRSPRISSPPCVEPKNGRKTSTRIIIKQSCNTPDGNNTTPATKSVAGNTTPNTSYGLSENSSHNNGTNSQYNKSSTPDSARLRELKKLEDYWTKRSPVPIEDSPRLRRTRKFDMPSSFVPANNINITDSTKAAESNDTVQLPESDSLPESPVPKPPQRTNTGGDSDHSYSVYEANTTTSTAITSINDSKQNRNNGTPNGESKVERGSPNTIKKRKNSSPTNIFVQFGVTCKLLSNEREHTHQCLSTDVNSTNYDKSVPLRRSSRSSPAITGNTKSPIKTNAEDFNDDIRYRKGTTEHSNNLLKYTDNRATKPYDSINILQLDTEQALTDSDDSDDDYIPPRKKLRSEVTNDELWDGIPTVSFKRLAPINKSRYGGETVMENATESSQSPTKHKAIDQREEQIINCEPEEEQLVEEYRLLDLPDTHSSTTTIDSVTENELLKETPSENNITVEYRQPGTPSKRSAQPKSTKVLSDHKTHTHRLETDTLSPNNVKQKQKSCVPKRSARLIKKKGLSPHVGTENETSDGSIRPFINKHHPANNQDINDQANGNDSLMNKSVSQILACTEHGDEAADKTEHYTNNDRRNHADIQPKEDISATLQCIFNSVNNNDRSAGSGFDGTESPCSSVQNNKVVSKINTVPSPAILKLEDPLAEESIGWFRTCKRKSKDKTTEKDSITNSIVSYSDSSSRNVDYEKPNRSRITNKKIGLEPLLIASSTNKSHRSTKKVPPLRIRLKHRNDTKAAKESTKRKQKEGAETKISKNIRDKSKIKMSNLSCKKQKIKKMKSNTSATTDSLPKTTIDSQKGNLKHGVAQKRSKKKYNKNTSKKIRRSLPTSLVNLRLNNEVRLSVAETLLNNTVLNKHACVIWSSENRRHQQLANADATHEEIDDILRQKWLALQDNERLRYFQRAQSASRDENKHSNRKHQETSVVKKETLKPEQNPSIDRFLTMDSQSQLMELKKWLHFYHEVTPEEYSKVMNSFKECLSAEREDKEREKERERERETCKSKSKKRKYTKKISCVKPLEKDEDCHARYRKLLFEKIFEVKDRVICIWNDKKYIQREMLIENFSGITKKLIAGENVPFSANVRSEKLTEVLTDIKGLEADRKISVIGDDNESSSCQELLHRLQDISPMKGQSQLPSPEVDLENYMEHMTPVKLTPLSPTLVEKVLLDVSGTSQCDAGPSFTDPTRAQSPGAMLTDWVIDDMVKVHPNLAYQGTVVFQDKDKITTGVFNSKKELCFPMTTRSGRLQSRSSQNSSMQSLLNTNHNNNTNYANTSTHYSHCALSSTVIPTSLQAVTTQSGNNTCTTNARQHIGCGCKSSLYHPLYSARPSSFVQYPRKAYTSVLTQHISDRTDARCQVPGNPHCNDP